MPVTTVTNSYNITVPAVFTVNETIYIVTLPGVPSDCSALALVDPYLPSSNFAGQTQFALLGFKNSALNAAFKNIYLKNGAGDFGKLIGRPADASYSSGNTKARAGLTKSIGTGVRPSNFSVNDSVDAPILGRLLNKRDAINKTVNTLGKLFFIPSGKVSSENWTTTSFFNIFKKNVAGIITYTFNGSVAGVDSIESFGAIHNATNTTNGQAGTTSAWVYRPVQTETLGILSTSSTIAVGNVPDTNLIKLTGTFLGGAGSINVSIFSDITGTQFGTNNTARPIFLGIVVKFVSPNNYFYITDGYPSFGSTEDQIKTFAGVGDFSLMHAPGLATSPTRFRGTPYCSGWQLRQIAASMGDMLTLAEGLSSQVNLFDDIYKTKKYVKAPVIIGTSDGGDFAIDAEIPAPFGNMRIVYSPRVLSQNSTVTYPALDDIISSTASIGSNRLSLESASFLMDNGGCIYEPLAIEKISAFSAVPSNYSAVKKLREKRIRSGSNPSTLINCRQTMRYGGGAFGDGPICTSGTTGFTSTNDVNSAYDLSTMPINLPMTFVLNTGAPPADITVQWCLWDSVTQAWAATGGTAVISLSETFGGSYARYTGNAPSSPTGDRQTQARISVAGGYSYSVYWSVDPARRRVWPWLIMKNKLLGSDATVVPAENLGALWNDPNPQPEIVVSGDWVIGWAGPNLTWNGAGLSISCTNRATSPEAGILGGIPSAPTAVAVRIKGTSLYQQSRLNSQYGPGWIFSDPGARPQTPAGTVLVVTAVTVIGWANKSGTGPLGSASNPLPNDTIDRDTAITFVREYEIIQP